MTPRHISLRQSGVRNEDPFARFAAAAVRRFSFCLSGAKPAAHRRSVPNEKLGTVNFPTSCAASQQKAFERGVALLHSFWYDQGGAAIQRHRGRRSHVRDRVLGRGDEPVARDLGPSGCGDHATRTGAGAEGPEAGREDAARTRLPGCAGRSSIRIPASRVSR